MPLRVWPDGRSAGPADYFRFPQELLGHTAIRIIYDVCGINRVIYDITSKPRDDQMGVRVTRPLG